MRKAEQKLMKRRMCLVARIVACVSFFVLVVIGVSSLVQAMSLENIENYDGIPASWKVSSLERPDTITLPITYWDQKADACDAKNRQFEWSTCGYWTHGVLPGIVKTALGADGLPVPAFSDSEASWSVNHDLFAMNVIGNDPVLPSDNFYRWFHEVPGLSRQINGRTVTFTRVGDNSYTYGGQNIYPLDDVAGIDESDVPLKGLDGAYHNFNFTAHLNFAVKIEATGDELFEFSGDDDVWFFLNNKLVLDIGGLHGAINGKFRINKDGTLTTYIEKVNDLSVRDDSWTSCLRDNVIGDFPSCVGPYNTKIRENFHNVEVKTLDIGLKPGDIVNLDFFYAERSTDASNTKITITNMDWPISADCDLTGKIVGKVENSNSNLVQYNTSITNRDPNNVLDLIRLAAHINDTSTNEDESQQPEVNSGYLPLDIKTLYYTTTPEDKDSWQAVDISAPLNSLDGFTLTTPIRMQPYGQTGDTLYFRFYAETSDNPTGTIEAITSFYTELLGVSGVTHDDTRLDYTNDQEIPPVDPDPDPDPNPDPNPVDPDPVAPIDPDPSEPDPIDPDDSNEDQNNDPVVPGPIAPDEDDDLFYTPPLGEIAFVPNTGIISDLAAPIFEQYFTNAVLSRGFILFTLLVFSGSFSVYFTLRKYLTMTAATRVTTISKRSGAKATVKRSSRIKSSYTRQHAVKATPKNKSASQTATKVKSNTKKTNSNKRATRS